MLVSASNVVKEFCNPFPIDEPGCLHDSQYFVGFLLHKQELSQEKLADLADLHFTYVSSVERGERNILLENIGKLAKAIGCEIKELFENN